MFVCNENLPVGSVIAFAGKIKNKENQQGFETDVAEFGWLVCDGRKVNICDYPQLFCALGFLYGGSEEHGQFNLPDYRGMFLRGIGNDESSLEDREKACAGEADGVGSTQECALQTHKHKYEKPVGATPGNSGNAYAATESELTSEPEKVNNQEVRLSKLETRPVNTFVYYLIKFCIV
ncbi:tail fiber protein [Prolixibacteraceae bacterium JC049]|nr:tail fiber protein [Prolixibacteraceae bacterium JC049]